MRKRRRHLTKAELGQIRALTLAGVRQSEISRKLHIGRDTVSKWQVRLGLPTRPTVPEDEIIRLFQKGWGGYKIHRFLKVPVNQIYRVAHQRGFKRADRIGYPEPHGDVAGFIEAVKNREDHITTLREK